MKTVFLALTKFMDLSGERNSKLREAIESENEQDDDPITVEPVAQEAPSEAAAEPIQYTTKDTDLVSPLSQWAIKTAASSRTYLSFYNSIVRVNYFSKSIVPF